MEKYALAHRYALISDATVEQLYGGDVIKALGGRSRCELFSFEPGEENKRRKTWGILTDRLLQADFGRDSAIVALGGGVTGDLAGFVAATFQRGIPYVQVPTTLLAMIDSSVGGKTGVDTSFGKNLVGAFHQPAVVVTDGKTLETLPKSHISAGMAEAIKHGAIADASYVSWIVSKRNAILSCDIETLMEVVRRSIKIKAAIVAEDEKESGRRAVLNFGHTVAHALEAASEFRLLHGEAVGLGMLAEAKLGYRLGVTDSSAFGIIREALEAVELPITMPQVPALESIVEAMVKDKKVRQGNIRFSFLDCTGESHQEPAGEWTRGAPKNAILEALTSVT